MGMTATERLRALLDERGVEWKDASPVPSMRQWKTSYQSFTGEEVTISDYDSPKWLMGTMVFYTPEQAIAATLGPEDAYTREDVEGAFVSGYSLGSLPVGSDPQWDQNEQTVDEHMAELGWVRKEAATLGPGTCHMQRFVSGTNMTQYGWRCTECGMPAIGFGAPRYCPSCGRRVDNG